MQSRWETYCQNNQSFQVAIDEYQQYLTDSLAKKKKKDYEYQTLLRHFQSVQAFSNDISLIYQKVEALKGEAFSLTSNPRVTQETLAIDIGERAADLIKQADQLKHQTEQWQGTPELQRIGQVARVASLALLAIGAALVVLGVIAVMCPPVAAALSVAAVGVGLSVHSAVAVAPALTAVKCGFASSGLGVFGVVAIEKTSDRKPRAVKEAVKVLEKLKGEAWGAVNFKPTMP